MTKRLWSIPFLFVSCLASSSFDADRNSVEDDYRDLDSSLHIPIPPPSHDAVRSVLSRFPPWIANEFSSIRVSTPTELEEGFAQLIGTPEGVQVEATSPVSALYAIHSYLQEFCGTQITWQGENVKKVGDCKRPESFERSYKSPRIRYFGNPCTYSYSFAWWDWSQWERMIDWMALSGLNAVLAPVGQEAIWSQVWKELGISRNGLTDFFSGPAFLAWHRMGNVQALGGPMSQDYLDSQLDLNKKIVKRMVQLGIVPILPTFSGFVPEEFERKHRHLRFLRNGCWNRLNETYSCTTSLHPEEDEFKEIAKLFIEKQKSVYGDITNAYSADPFNESPPKHLTDRDITSMSSEIYEGCKMANPNCVWFLQAWTFAYDGWKKENVKSFLAQVPKGKMVILDLQAEKRPLYKELDDFFGHSFVWCLLQNFGGNMQMRGNLGRLNEDYRIALASSTGMTGFGLTMEGINQNYVVYAYLVDLAWTDEEMDPHKWIIRYASARYGTSSQMQTRAWLILLSTYYTQVAPRDPIDNEVYEPNEREERREIFLYFRPKFLGRITYWFKELFIDKLEEAFTVLNKTLSSNHLFRQDFADVMREVIQRKLNNRIQSVYNGYSTSDPKLMKRACSEVDTLFDKLDRNEVHRLSDWILMAREAGTSEAESDLYEKQARNQVTLWGPAGENPDYARKEWQGLIRKFYSKRWSCFCEFIQSGVRYNQKKFEEKLWREVELPFAHL